MTDAALTKMVAEQQYTISAAISFGWASMELCIHLYDEYKLLQQWRWGHTVYFACRYTGLMISISFLVLACVGNQSNADSLCKGFYIFEHVMSSFLFLSSGAMFWIRAGFICRWKKILVIPLALYGLIIAAFAMKSDVSDYNRASFLGSTSTSLVCAIKATSKREQAMFRFLMALFDVLTAVITFTYLKRNKMTPQTWLSTLLTRDQLIYVCATTLTYITLGIDLLLNATNRRSYLGVICPSIVSIISCRLFLHLKRKGLEDNDVSVKALNMDLSPSPSRSHPHRSKDYEEHALKVSPWSLVSPHHDGSRLQQPLPSAMRPIQPSTSQIALLPTQNEPSVLSLSASLHPYTSCPPKEGQAKDCEDHNDALK